MKQVDKKLNQDARSWTQAYRIFLINVQNVLMKWVTWCGRTFTFLGMKGKIPQALMWATRRRSIPDCVNLLHNWQEYIGGNRYETKCCNCSRAPREKMYNFFVA